MKHKKILIADDERQIVEILKFNLELIDEFDIECAYDGQEAIQSALNFKPSVSVIDVMLPVKDGLEVCKTIKSETDSIVILFSAKSENEDKIKGYNAGADDYLEKPFSLFEFIKKITINFKKSIIASSNKTHNELKFGEILVDSNRNEIYKNQKPLGVTAREFEIVKLLASNPGKIFSRKELLQNVWKCESTGDDRVVDVAIRRVREKIESNPSSPSYIQTRRRAGYYFDITPE